MPFLPLPASWTFERVDAVLDAGDYSVFGTLAPGDVDLIINYMNERDRPMIEAAQARQAALDATDDAERAASGQESRSAQADRVIKEEQCLMNAFALDNNSLVDVARIMQDGAEMDIWGFVVFKATMHGEGEEEKRWKLYKQRVNEVFEYNLEASGARLGEGLAAKWFIHWVEEGFEDGNIDRIRQEFVRLSDEEVIPEGLDQDLCLVADARAVSSLLDTGLKPSTHLGAVCREDPAEELELDEDEIPTSVGYFKVQLKSVLPSLYIALNKSDPYELYPGAGCIWNDGYDLIVDDDEVYEREERGEMHRGTHFTLRPATDDDSLE